MPENLLTTEETGHLGQLFLECDKDGRVFWMSDRARERLGNCSSLFELLTTEEIPRFARYLESCDGVETLKIFYRRDAQRTIPVLLFCILRSEHRRLLSVEFRERGADRFHAASEELASMQTHILTNYFRLLRAQQLLDSRLQRGRRNPGKVLLEQMERERARVARDLHTGAGQWLAAINVHLELIERQAPELPAGIREYLERIRLLARQAVAEIRSISHRLHPLEWKALPLAAALRQLWTDSGIGERFQASLTLNPLADEPAEAVRIAIYRIAQEALSNTIRHADATALALTLSEKGGKLRLTIEDNGRGFDVGTRPAAQAIGLRAMRDQARDLGGEIRVTSGPHGTKLEVAIPLHSGDE